MSPVRIAVGSDHGGFHLKDRLIRQMRSAGHAVRDLGAFSPRPSDYPAIGAAVARAVRRRQVHRGLLLCKSGGGMAIVANRFAGVRAVVCPSLGSARHAREHNDANVLVLGAEGVSPRQARGILSAWLGTPFAGGRHARRLRQITAIERDVIARARSARSNPRRLLHPCGVRNDDRG